MTIIEQSTIQPARAAHRCGFILGRIMLSLFFVGLCAAALAAGLSAARPRVAANAGGPSGAASAPPSIPGATLRPMATMSYDVGGGLGQQAYLLSYGDGSRGLYVVATSRSAPAAQTVSWGYYQKATRRLEGGSVSPLWEAGQHRWAVVEQGAQCRVSIGYAVLTVTAELTVTSPDCAGAQAHIAAWNRYLAGAVHSGP